MEDPTQRRLMGWETFVVLAVFPLGSTFAAVVALIQRVEFHVPISSNSVVHSSHVWLSVLLTAILAVVFSAPVALVAYLVARSGEGPLALNLDRARWRQDLALVLPVYVLVFWLPQVFGQHFLSWIHVNGYYLSYANLPSRLGLTVAQFFLSAQAALAEEIVVLAYLVRRLEQRGYSVASIVAIDWVVRVSYHLYYGWNAIPILLWAVASVVVYLRIRRLLPFIICHIVWDVAIPLRAFYGGTYHVLFYLSIVVTAVMTIVWARWAPPAPHQLCESAVGAIES